jgi:hypothetical protein
MSILEEAVPATEVEVSPEKYEIKALILGPSGSGKTTSAITLPPRGATSREEVYGKVLLIDCDNRAASVAGFKNVEVLPCHEPNPKSPKAWQRLLDIKTELDTYARKAAQGKEDFPYDGIVGDGISSMGRIAMYSALLLDPKRGLGGSPAKHHYPPQMKYMADLINGMLTLPCHVIFTGHPLLIDDEATGGIHYVPKMFGKHLRAEAPAWFSECYLAEKEPTVKDGKAKDLFKWMTSGTDEYRDFKSSLNQLGHYWSDPVVIDMEAFLRGEPTGFADLVGRRFGKEGGDSKKT